MYEGQYVDSAAPIEEGREYTLGNIYLTGNGKKITFTINGTTYEAEEEMEWGAWIQTDYNKLGELCVSDSMICGQNNSNNMHYDGLSVKDEDYIIANGSYEFK